MSVNGSLIYTVSLNNMDTQYYEEDSLEETTEPPTVTLKNMIQYSQELQDHGTGLNNQLDLLMENVMQSEAKADAELEIQFQKVEFLIRSWKCEFEQELRDFYRRQKFDLQRQIDQHQEISSSLTKALLRAKVSQAANFEYLTEDHILSHLEELMEPAQRILDMKVDRPSPVNFIPNEGFHLRILKPEDRHEIGYIQHLPLTPQDLLLVQVFDASQDENMIVFKAEAYKEFSEFEDLLKNCMSWNLKLCEIVENHQSNVKCIWTNGEIFFHIQLNSHSSQQFSVFLYNQHIMGSPQRFSLTNTCTSVDQEHPVQVTRPTPVKPTANLYMPSESPEKRIPMISRKDISAINIYLEKAKLENSNMDKYHNEAVQHLDGAFKDNEQNETDFNKSLNEEFPDKGHDISPGGEKRVVRKGRPDTCTPLRRPKFQEIVQYSSEIEVKGETGLNLGGTADFTPTFSSTTKLPIVDDLEDSKLQNDNCDSLGTNSYTVGNLTNMLEKVVEIKNSPHDIWEDHILHNTEYEKNDHEDLNLEKSYLNSSGPLIENPFTEKKISIENPFTEEKISIPKSCDSELSTEYDYQKENNHNVSFLQRGLFAQLKLKMSLSKENSLNKPVGVTQLKNGKVIIADTFNDRMVLFSKRGDFIKSFSSPQMKRPSAIVVLTDGLFAVKDIHSILLFTANGEYVDHLRHATHLKHPYGLTMDDEGKLLTIETTHDGHVTIVVMDPMGSCGLSRVKVNLGLSKEQAAQSKPRFIAYQGNNTILVVDLGLNCIYRILYSMAEGVVVNRIGEYGIGEGQFWDPSGIVVDAEGFIMVGDSRNHRIQVFDPNGQFVSLLQVDTPLRRPSGLFLTPCGHLLIINYWENNVAKYQLKI